MQDSLYMYRWQIALVLLGAILVAGGIILTKRDLLSPATVEIVADESTPSGNIRVEVSGKVKNPGVYSLSKDSRIDDALSMAGGFTEEADSAWIEKFINRAAKVIDGQKIYIPSSGEQSTSSSANNSGGDSTLGAASQNVISANNSLIDINTASLKELESLWGIGPVIGQKIIEQRPYSNTEEILTKGIVKKNVWERIKDQISVY